MSIWNRIIDIIGAAKTSNNIDSDIVPERRNAENFAFVDVEVGMKDHKIHDIGALRHDGATFHKNSKVELREFLSGVEFVCGHNIVHHDAKYLFDSCENTRQVLVDTLYMSPLLFPERPYHHLVKDDKLLCDEMNNPVNDCEKARELLFDEVTRWRGLSENHRLIFATLLAGQKEFVGFMQMVSADIGQRESIPELIRAEYEGKICANANIRGLIDKFPCPMAYALALIGTTDQRSVTPPWVLYNHPEVEHVIKILRHTRCAEGCDYCNDQLDAHRNLKRFFGYESFRTYDGEPLQENAVCAAIDGKSLQAIFPTGGGKSLTFQLPALIEGRTVHGLTVVISPLQSLMKDQVDNLADRGITDAVTINGLLDPISRSLAIERVQSGDASLLFIAPEMLRSKTIERILMARHVVRFVIDEAHCFSAWGQDFRVDYLYIGKFIKDYQGKKGHDVRVPVSCFTATAKQKVVQDICDYFKHWLDIDLQLFASSASRKNLRYKVIHVDTDDDKYAKLRELVMMAACPTIIYVSRTKRTRLLASQLTRDGLKALPYNGKMDSDEKIKNQDEFMSGRADIIVATSAFGMGVDKSDVGLVVHYDISDSLENYVQEAGRAGRDPNLTARCFVLYCDSDLDKHFILLNQTKLSLCEIQQVWQAVKSFTRQRQHVCCSALEIARQAGWDDSVSDIETRVRTALSALEQSGYIERGNNVPHVYATGITVRNMDEARRRIMASSLFGSDEVEKAVRIIKSLISQKHIAKAQNSEVESRIDYLADMLGMNKREIVSAVERMRQEGILADSKDISAFLQDVGSERKARQTLEYFAQLEEYIIKNIPDESLCVSYKQLNDNAVREGLERSTEKNIRTLLYFLAVKGYTRKTEDASRSVTIRRQTDMAATLKRFEKRLNTCRFVVEWLYRQAERTDSETEKNGIVQFSVVELLNDIRNEGRTLFASSADIQLEDVEEALLYLSKIGALKLEGGFLVLYNAMDIRRLKDTRLRYKKDDYRTLNEFYKQKMQQIHIVGEYANLMVANYDAALRYVHDYFHMDYNLFISKYFKGERVEEISRNLTPAKYRQMFGQLSDCQRQIISDRESRCIVVAAGPGSGKTRVLVRKLASLLLLEDVKHEQLLMLTFSRAAASEFKQRLMQLIGNAAHFVEIKTFHSYCFDLLGRVGNLDDASGVVAKATEMISDGEVEPNHIGKTVLVIDEAQDMGKDDYALVSALMTANEDMRVIAVGDDDQNIYEFRGSASKYMYRLSNEAGGRFIEMTENYRSSRLVVDAANDFVKSIRRRLKTGAIVSMSGEDGEVRITRHVSKYMFLPVAADVMGRGNGTTCVLTQTNDEAVMMLALLNSHGVRCKLVQSMDGLRFCNMMEMRYFLKCVYSRKLSPIIADEAWDEAKQKTFSKYATSESLQYVCRCVEMFEQTNRAKYYSDFREFVFESLVEDFCDLSGAEVVVSTVHKSKGREFDNVYMLIDDRFDHDDNLLRRYYVGMTRAKRNLYVHTNGNVFDGIRNAKRVNDTRQYAMPDEIVLQLSHKDVYLDFFKCCKVDVLALRSGDKITYHAHYLFNPSTGRVVAKLSQGLIGKLAKWETKGYVVVSASVRFIVAWRPKNVAKEEKELAVLLADMRLRKNQNP